METTEPAAAGVDITDSSPALVPEVSDAVTPTLDISLVVGPANLQDEGTTKGATTAKFFRHPNPGGNFYTGLDITSEAAVQRRAARMKRFGFEAPPTGSDPVLSVGRREARAKRFGTKLVAAKGEPIKLMNSLPELPMAAIRLEAVHLHGTDEMNTSDVFSYFNLYSPRNIEWINDTSCNVVWEDRGSAARALFGVGRQPVALQSQYEAMDTTAITTSKDLNLMVEGNQTEVDQNQTEEKQVDQNQTEANRMEIDEEQVSAGTPKSSKRERKLEEGEGEGLEEGEVAAEVQWRIGQDHPKAKQLLLRYATVLDVKEKDAAMHSIFYRKYGRPALQQTSAPDRQNKAIAKEDLRSRIGKKHSNSEPSKSGDEAEMTGSDPELDNSRMESRLDNPFASLAKRPKPLYSDRPDDLLDVTEMMEDSEKERLAQLVGVASEKVGLGDGEGDLRRALQLKKKRRNLKLRVGYNPRPVPGAGERH